jgi:putative membrane protein
LVDALHHVSASDRERVRAALEHVRAATSAKFAFVAVPASDRYVLFPEVWAAVVSLALTGALALARPHLPIGAGFAVNAALFIALSFIFEWRPIHIRLVPAPFKRAAVSRLARHEFAVHVISRDKENNGVMLFASLAERHLEIIAERDAHAHAPTGTWETIVANATATMRNQSVAEGLIQAILACGQVQAASFPAQPSEG